MGLITKAASRIYRMNEWPNEWANNWGHQVSIGWINGPPRLTGLWLDRLFNSFFYFLSFSTQKADGPCGFFSLPPLHLASQVCCQSLSEVGLLVIIIIIAIPAQHLHGIFWRYEYLATLTKHATATALTFHSHSQREKQSMGLQKRRENLRLSFAPIMISPPPPPFFDSFFVPLFSKFSPINCRIYRYITRENRH